MQRAVLESSGKASVGRELTFTLNPLPPFRLELTVWTLRRRPSNLIDRWDGRTYRRILMLNNQAVEVAVTATEQGDASPLAVTLIGARIDSETKKLAAETVERLLGLKTDLTPFYQLAVQDAKLGPLVDRLRGLKPPRYPTLFETLVNTIACQQISLSVGIILLSRLTQKFGVAVEGSAGVAHAFPRPEDLAPASPDDLRALGFSYLKAGYVMGLARTWREGDWADLEQVDNKPAIARLQQLPGIGRWSAEYVLLRGLGRLEVYPGDDVGARNNLSRWLKLRKPLDYERVRRVLARWRPYAGMVYFHLLVERLIAAGKLSPE